MNFSDFLGVINSYTNDNIIVAAGDGDVEKVKSYLDQGISPNTQDQNGYSPMHAAVSYGNLDVLKLLISRGGDVLLKDSDGDTPLHVCEDRACGEYLIQNGAKYDIPNNEGKTPIWYAVEEDFPFMIDYYLEKGILSPELLTRIRADVENASDCHVCNKQSYDNALPISSLRAAWPSGQDPCIQPWSICVLPSQKTRQVPSPRGCGGSDE